MTQYSNIFNQQPMILASRASSLAIAQVQIVADKLAPMPVDLLKLTTSGDRILDRSLADAGGKGLFIKELESSLLRGDADAAVHSMKDMEASFASGTCVAAVLPREDRRDALVGPFSSLADLPQGAVIGTSSVRRRALLLHHRPDLEIRLLRGNVNTRIAAMREGRFDAIILAMAGLRRLGLDVPHSAISPDIMLPSAGQGALAIQARNADDSRSQAVIDAAATIGCAATTTEVTAERALLGRLDGSCHTPIAASATLQPDGRLHLDGMILSTDGSNAFRDSLTGVASDAVQIGVALADQLLGAAGGRDFLA
ncbi:MAG TPA: hydroxymethylbilane synthase [Alphaproteobacteria bacterium]|nr:hydroxymethylbilane synthase [Alphaproteobacteria bacterium]|tara:strand:- start:137 stop:1072 length:936 start_codon:yes stop_codon:yes gene_type:complete